MDKIENQDWANIFSEISQKEMFRSERYTEVTTYFKEPGLAAAQVTSIQTPGIELVQANFNTERKLVLVDYDNAEKISSSFILDGDLESQFAVNNNSVVHWVNTHGFQYTPDFQGRHIIHNKKLQAFSLFYDKDYFKSIAVSAGTRYLDSVLNCIERRETLLVPPGQLALQPVMTGLLNAISKCNFHGLTRYLFMEAKMLELLALQMEQLNALDHVKDEWSIPDRERLRAIHNFICKHFLEPLSLKSICVRFGTNEFKLKKGYKHFFGTTVFGHIHSLRMETAQSMLVSGEMNVSEVSFHIGYNNISSFSEAFKKHFDYLPGKLSSRVFSLDHTAAH